MTAAEHIPKRRPLREIVGDLIALIEAAEGEVTDDIDELGLELEDKVDAYRVIMLQYEEDADSNTALAKHYALRATGLHHQAEQLKRRLLDAMTAAGIPKIKGVTCTAYTQASTSVEVDADFVEHAPDRYVRVVTTSTPDKKLIKQDLDAGGKVAGAKLVQSVSLRFR